MVPDVYFCSHLNPRYQCTYEVKSKDEIRFWTTTCSLLRLGLSGTC